MTDLTLTGPARSRRPAYTFRARLDGIEYQFRFVFNTRSHRWHMDLRDSLGAALVTGLRVTAGVDLIAPLVGETVPPGQLFVVDDEGIGEDPDRFSFLGAYRLIYRDAAGVAAAVDTDDEVR